MTVEGQTHFSEQNVDQLEVSPSAQTISGSGCEAGILSVREFRPHEGSEEN